jgi:hypothetical protein
MIQHYKDNFVRTTDMFLVRNSLLHHYVNKLNKYEEISYISEHDILLNTQKEEVVEKKMDNDEKVEDIIKNDIVSNVEIKEPSSPVIIKVPKRRRRRQPKQTNELEVNAS